MIFVEAEDRVLIDDIVQFSGILLTEGMPASGTPQP